MFSTMRYHKLELKGLAQYLNNNQDRGLVLDPNSDICEVYAQPDADFAGMYEYKSHDDSTFDKSCTGFIITFSHFSVLWISKLKTETSLYTMEAEIIFLAHCC